MPIDVTGRKGVFTPSNDNSLIEAFPEGKGIRVKIEPVDDSERCRLDLYIPQFLLKQWSEQLA